MISLISCDYQELLAQQPVSRSGLAMLQRSAQDGNTESVEWLRKNMISLGAYLALRRIEKNHLDQELVLSHIDADRLEKLGYTKSFSVWGEETVHIDLVRKYINAVIRELYVRTQDGKYVERQTYQRVTDALAQWMESRQGTPSANKLAQAANVASEIADSVLKKEIRKREQAAAEEKEKQRYQRLREIIRDSDMTFKKKYDLLVEFALTPRKKLAFFYALYGVDDGIQKTPEEISTSFSMTPEEARQYYQGILDKRHWYRNPSLIICGPCLTNSFSNLYWSTIFF